MPSKEAAVKAQSVATAHNETTTIAKTDGVNSSTNLAQSQGIENLSENVAENATDSAANSQKMQKLLKEKEEAQFYYDKFEKEVGEFDIKKIERLQKERERRQDDYNLSKFAQALDYSRSSTGLLSNDYVLESVMPWLKEHGIQLKIAAVTPHNVAEGYNFSVKFGGQEFEFSLAKLKSNGKWEIRGDNKEWAKVRDYADKFELLREYEHAKETLNAYKKDLERINAEIATQTPPDSLFARKAKDDGQPSLFDEHFNPNRPHEKEEIGEFDKAYNTQFSTHSDEIKRFYKENVKDKESNVIFDKAFLIARKFGVKVRFAATKEGRSHYNLKDNEIVIEAGNPAAIQAQDLLHEIIHATTRRALKLVFTDKNFAAARKILTDRQLRALREINELYNLARSNWGNLTPEQQNALKAQYGDEFLGYGFKNIDEFISELSNKNFREYLKTQSIWEKIKNALYTFFFKNSEPNLRLTNYKDALKDRYFQFLEDFEQKPPQIRKTATHSSENLFEPSLFNKQSAYFQALQRWHKDSSPLTKNADGTPKVFYHGSREKENLKEFRHEFDKSGWGFWLTTDEKVAKLYTKGDEKKLTKAFIKLKNPLRADKPFSDSELAFLAREFDLSEKTIAKYKEMSSLWNKGKDEAAREDIKILAWRGNAGYLDTKIGKSTSYVAYRIHSFTDYYHNDYVKEKMPNLYKFWEEATKTRLANVENMDNELGLLLGLESKEQYSQSPVANARARLKAAGYDGIILNDRTAVVFDSNQIKKVNQKGQNGRYFDPEKANINYASNRLFSADEIKPRLDSGIGTATQSTKENLGGLFGGGGNRGFNTARNALKRTQTPQPSLNFGKDELRPSPATQTPTKSTLERDLTPQEISEVVNKWDLENPKPNDRLIVSKVQGDELAQLEKEFKFNGNYAVAREINAEQMKHALKSHGDEAVEAARGQIPVSKDEIANYQQWTKNYDIREVQGDKIIYAKQINGNYVVLEEVQTGKNKIEFFDMWKGKGKINKQVLLSHSQRPKHASEPNSSHRMPSNDENSSKISPQSQAQISKEITTEQEFVNPYKFVSDFIKSNPNKKIDEMARRMHYILQNEENLDGFLKGANISYPSQPHGLLHTMLSVKEDAFIKNIDKVIEFAKNADFINKGKDKNQILDDLYLIKYNPYTMQEIAKFGGYANPSKMIKEKTFKEFTIYNYTPEEIAQIELGLKKLDFDTPEGRKLFANKAKNKITYPFLDALKAQNKSLDYLIEKDLKLYGLAGFSDDEIFNKMLEKVAKKADTDIRNVKRNLVRDIYINTPRENIEKALNTKPLKEFGTNYAEFTGDGVNAVKKLVAESEDYANRAAAGTLSETEKAQGGFKGQVAGAFSRDDLGMIDLVWGQSYKNEKGEWQGFGLAHIIDKRKSEFLKGGMSEAEAERRVLEFVENELDNIIKNGTLTKEANNKITLKTPQHTLILGVRENNGKNKFIITAYKDNNLKELESLNLGQSKTFTSENAQVGDSFTSQNQQKNFSENLQTNQTQTPQTPESAALKAAENELKKAFENQQKVKAAVDSGESAFESILELTQKAYNEAKAKFLSEYVAMTGEIPPADIFKRLENGESLQVSKEVSTINQNNDIISPNSTQGAKNGESEIQGNPQQVLRESNEQFSNQGNSGAQPSDYGRNATQGVESSENAGRDTRGLLPGQQTADAGNASAKATDERERIRDGEFDGLPILNETDVRGLARGERRSGESGDLGESGRGGGGDKFADERQSGVLQGDETLLRGENSQRGGKVGSYENDSDNSGRPAVFERPRYDNEQRPDRTIHTDTTNRGGGLRDGTAATTTQEIKSDTNAAGILNPAETAFVKNQHFTQPDLPNNLSPKEIYDNNIAALRVLNELLESGRMATQEEKEILSRYSGAGGSFSNHIQKIQNTPEIAELETLLAKIDEKTFDKSDITALHLSLNDFNVRSKDAYFTPTPIIKAMTKLAKDLGLPQDARILEPSAGSGRFIGHFENQANIDAVEIDKITALIAQKIYPNANIENAAFQSSTISKKRGYDLIIGNPPYSAEKIDGRPMADYFMLNSIEKLAENGISIQIVSHNFMDKNSPTKHLIANQAEFLGGVRLPNNAFGKETGITTDILVFRKGTGEEIEKGFDKSWIKVEQTSYGDVSSYFWNNDDAVMGQFKAETGQFGNRSWGLENENFKVDDFANIDLRDYINPAPNAFKHDTLRFDDTTPKVQNKGEISKESVMDKVNQSLYKNWSDGRKSTEIDKYLKQVPQIQKLKDTLKALHKAELSGETSDEVLDDLRKQLNKDFDDLTGGKGFYNDEGKISKEFKIFEVADDESFELLALTNKNNERSEIFTRRVINPYSPPLNANNLKEAIDISLNELGKYDLDRISSLLNKDIKQTETEMLDARHIYKNAKGENVKSSDFLSGDVKTKLEEFHENGEAKFSTDPEIAKYQKIAYEDLKKVIPKDIDLVDIDIPLGANFVDANLWESFLRDKLGMSATLRYTHGFGWKFKNKGYKDYLNEFFIATSPEYAEKTKIHNVYALEFLEDMFNIKNLAVKKSVKQNDGSTITYKDPIATQQVEEAKKQIAEMFKEYVSENGEYALKVVRQYNDIFNRNVLKKYDGSHLTFPNMNKDIELHNIQRNGVQRIIENFTTLLGHAVGVGKTWLMGAAAMECKRLKQLNKSIVVCPNGVASQFAAETRRLYPTAKIKLVNAMSAREKNRQLAELKNNDYDLIVITATAFEKIDVSPEAYRKFFEEEIKFFTKQAETLRAENAGKREINRATDRVKNAQERIKKQLARVQKEGVTIFWDDLGIDGIFVDEAHKYKNLPLYTQQQNVRGIGKATANRAIDMYIKIMNANTRKTIFATGTPITNYVTDIFVWQKYLDSQTLKAKGVDMLDEWCKLYAQPTSEFELKATGEYKQTARLREFSNLPELQSDYLGFTDLITKQDLAEELARQGKPNPEPEIVREDVILERSAAQSKITNEMRQIAKEAEASVEAMRKFMQWGGMLKVTGILNKASLDMRLIDPNLPRDPNGKLAAAAEKIYEKYKEFDKYKGTQLVFLDKSTPKNTKKLSESEKKKLNEQLEKIEAKLNDDTFDGDIDELNAKKETIKEKLLSADSERFSAYEDLKQILIEKGIKPDEIDFIHNYDGTGKTDEMKDKLAADISEKINSGKVRVLLGSTAKMGAGMNFQKRLVALHHMDFDWTPANMEQREGRIIRQGNELLKEIPNFKATIYSYATKEMSDSLVMQILAQKTKIIRQLNTLNKDVRRIIDDSEDDMYQRMMASTQKNSEIIFESMQLDKDIRILQSKFNKKGKLIKNNETLLQTAHNNIAHTDRQEKMLREFRAEKNIIELENGRLYNKEKGGYDEYKRAWANLDDKDLKSETKEMINEAIKEKLREFSWASDNLTQIGTLRGKKILAKKEGLNLKLYVGDSVAFGEENVVPLRVNGDATATLSEVRGYTGDKTPDFLLQFKNALNQIDGVLKENRIHSRNTIEKAENSLKEAQRMDVSDLADEIKRKQQRLDELNIFRGLVDSNNYEIYEAKYKPVYGENWQIMISRKIQKEIDVKNGIDSEKSPLGEFFKAYNDIERDDVFAAKRNLAKNAENSAILAKFQPKTLKD